MLGHPANLARPAAARRARTLAIAALAPAILALGGCNDAQAFSLLGAGIGALAGQAIGHDTEATLIGTGIGAVGGYIIGNESDKARWDRWNEY